MFVIKKEKNQILSLPVKEITAKEAKNFSSDLALKILKLLIKKPMYPIELAKELKVHEQKIYYHIRNLEKSGIIKINKKEIKQGAVAKYYYLDKPAFVIRLKEFEETQKIIPKSSSTFLEPFIKNGELDAMIIVGSPDPHGPEKARSRDGYYGIDLALFLGTFLNYVPDLNVRLDTEVRQEELKVHEQKVYYHIRNLEKSGIIKINKKEIKQGAVAKYYYLDKPAFVIRLKEFEETQKIIPKSSSKFLEPFIKNGELDAMIIVGSPDPHGPEKARSRDGYYGIDLALFLGTFLNYVPDLNVRLDTEVRQEELKNNLILLGGPVVNNITKKVNEKMPIFFDKNNHWAIKSNISKNVYPTDETGLIASFKNPFNKEKSILLVAGKRYSGTRAAIIAFLKYFKEVSKGNIHNNKIKARVVEGVDLNSDGIIDDVEFRE